MWLSHALKKIPWINPGRNIQRHFNFHVLDWKSQAHALIICEHSCRAELHHAYEQSLMNVLTSNTTSIQTMIFLEGSNLTIVRSPLAPSVLYQTILLWYNSEQIHKAHIYTYLLSIHIYKRESFNSWRWFFANSSQTWRARGMKFGLNLRQYMGSDVMGLNFKYHSQGWPQAQKGVGKCSPEALASRILKL